MLCFFVRTFTFKEKKEVRNGNAVYRLKQLFLLQDTYSDHDDGHMEGHHGHDDMLAIVMVVMIFHEKRTKCK